MGNLYMEGISVDELTAIIGSEVSKKVAEAMAGQQQDKWLSVNEALKLFQPAICRNTFNKWSDLYHFKMQRFCGQKKYLMSDIMNQANQVKKYSQLN